MPTKIRGSIFLFYENVRDLCALHRTNITQLAKDLGLSTSMPTKWKNGSIPKSDTLKMIADHFGVSTDSLLAPSGNSATIGDVSGSAVLLGNHSKSINVQNGAALTSEESELIRIYRALDVRARMDLMRLAFEAEDKQKGV